MGSFTTEWQSFLPKSVRDTVMFDEVQIAKNHFLYFNFPNLVLIHPTHGYITPDALHLAAQPLLSAATPLSSLTNSASPSTLAAAGTVATGSIPKATTSIALSILASTLSAGVTAAASATAANTQRNIALSQNGSILPVSRGKSKSISHGKSRANMDVNGHGHHPQSSSPSSLSSSSRDTSTGAAAKLGRFRFLCVEAADFLGRHATALDHLYAKPLSWLSPGGGGSDRACKAWFALHEKRQYDQAILVGTTILERLLGNIIVTRLGRSTAVPFLIKDLLSEPGLVDMLGIDLITMLHTLVGPPTTINLRNLCWHGFIMPHDLLPLRAYSSMLLVLTMTVARTAIQKQLALQPRPLAMKTYYYASRTTQPTGDFDDTFDRTVYKLGIPPTKVIDLASVRGFFRGTGGRSKFVTDGTQNQWEAACKNLDPPATSSFLFVVASLPLLEHCLRRVYVRTNECRPDRVNALVGGDYYLTLDVIIAPFVPFELLTESRQAKIEEKDRKTIRNAIFDEYGDGCLNVYHDLFINPLGPRLRDRVSHGEMNQFLDRDVTQENWFQYYLGLVVIMWERYRVANFDSQYLITNCLQPLRVTAEEYGRWAAQYFPQRFDPFSMLKKEATRSMSMLIDYNNASIASAQASAAASTSSSVSLTGAISPSSKSSFLNGLPGSPSKLAGSSVLSASTLSKTVGNGSSKVASSDSSGRSIHSVSGIRILLFPVDSVVFSDIETFTSSTPIELGCQHWRFMQPPTVFSRNIMGWLAIVKMIQGAISKVSSKIDSFSHQLFLKQLSSRYRKQFRTLSDVAPELMGMLVGCLAVVEQVLFRLEWEPTTFSPKPLKSNLKGNSLMNGNGYMNGSGHMSGNGTVYNNSNVDDDITVYTKSSISYTSSDVASAAAAIKMEAKLRKKGQNLEPLEKPIEVEQERKVNINDLAVLQNSTSPLEAEEIQIRFRLTTFLEKFMSCFERSKFAEIESAWTELKSGLLHVMPCRSELPFAPKTSGVVVAKEKKEKEHSEVNRDNGSDRGAGVGKGSSALDGNGEEAPYEYQGTHYKIGQSADTSLAPRSRTVSTGSNTSTSSGHKQSTAAALWTVNR